MVEITPLPKAPGIVLGIVNYRGRILPAIDLRSRFGLPTRPIALTDQLLIARTPRRSVALVADAVEDVVECLEHEMVVARAVVPGTDYVDGVAKLSDGLVLIHGLDRCLSFEEERQLDEATPDA